MKKTNLALSLGLCTAVASCGGGGGGGSGSQTSPTPAVKAVKKSENFVTSSIANSVISATQQLPNLSPKPETSDEIHAKGSSLNTAEKPWFNGEISRTGSSVSLADKPIFDGELRAKGTSVSLEEKPHFDGTLTAKGLSVTRAEKPVFDGELRAKGSSVSIDEKPTFQGELTPPPTTNLPPPVEAPPAPPADPVLPPPAENPPAPVVPPSRDISAENTELAALNHTATATTASHPIAIMDTAFTSQPSQVGNRFGNRLTIYRDPRFAGDAVGDKRSHGTFVSAIIAQENQTAPLYAYTSAWEDSPSTMNINSNSFRHAYQQGIRIFNLSFGTTSRNGEPSSGQDHSKIGRFAKENGIFVLAAGNERQPYASNQSYAILTDPAMKNGWIVVAAVPHPNAGELAEYSNQIGSRLQNYGITAQGNWSLRMNNELIRNDGTSFAAPMVSAVVGKIWDKFPWMDNHLVTMTLLSSASKPAKPNEPTEAPNPKFGWGILNEDRALNGLARLDTKLMTERDDLQNNLIRVKIEPKNYTQAQLTWRNDIAGDAGLLKEGEGALYLTGNNRYIGDTVVRQGVLAVTNQLASKVKIERQGHLWLKNETEAVKIRQNLDNQGSLYLYGKGLTLDGDYTASSDARLVIDLDTAKFQASGTVAFNGSRIVADIEQLDRLPTRAVQEKVVAEAREIQGYQPEQVRISTRNKPYIELESLVQRANQLVARYQRHTTETALTRSGTTPTAVHRHTASQLDRVLDEAAHHANTPIEASSLELVNAFAAELPAQIDSLSGELHISSLTQMAQRTQALNRQLSQRLFSAKNSPIFTAWAEGQQGKTRLAQADFARLTANERGVRLGLEKGFEQGVWGVGVQSGKSDLGFEQQAGSADLTHKGGFVYAKYQPSAVYAMATLGYQQSRVESRRTVLNQQASADYRLQQFNAYGELGYRLPWLTPFIGYEWQSWWHKAWREQVALGVAADKQRHQWQAAVVGLHFAQPFATHWQLSGSLSHRVQLGSAKLSLQGQFNGSSQAARFIGISPAKQQTWLDLGLAYQIGNISLTARVETGWASHQKASHQLKIGGEYRFGQ